QVDLVQSRAEYLTRPHGCENQEFERELRRLVHAALAQPADKLRHFRIGHRGEVPGAVTMARQRSRDTIYGIVAGAMTCGLCPVEHGANALTDSPCRFGLAQPYRRQRL